jgi:hypothetical protein
MFIILPPIVFLLCYLLYRNLIYAVIIGNAEEIVTEMVIAGIARAPVQRVVTADPDLVPVPVPRGMCLPKFYDSH